MTKSQTILTKTQILDAAEETLRRFGPDKASVTDVAKLLHVSHGTIYRHYENKVALREAVTERWLEEKIITPLTDVLNRTSSNTCDHLKLYIGHLIELKQQYARIDKEMFKMYAEVTEQSANLIKRHVRIIIEQLSTLIASGRLNGEIAVTDVSTLAETIFMATSRFHHPAHANEWENEDCESNFNNVWDLILRAIAIK